MEPNKTSDEPHVDLYTIPSHSRWFSWADIHETERLHLREFFDGASITRTPKIYKEYRDFIISKYRECPSRRLSFTEARKSLVGDVSVLHKVFRFLDSNGLINFGAAAAEEEETEGEGKVRMEEGMPVGIRVVTVPNAKAAILTPPPGRSGGRTVENGSLLPPLASYKDVYGDTNEAVCRHCKQRCGSANYQCVKEGCFRVCIKCFNNGNYGKDNSIDDFKLIGDISNSENYSSVWTEAETLLLLESVLKNGDDWDLVAENVKTKNKADCISKLIQLPFGDLMLGSSYGRGKLLDIGLNKSKKLASSEHNSMENQCPNVENATKKNGNAETEKQNSPEIESKENGNSEIEFKKNGNSESKFNENGNSGIETTVNENADLESKENENIEIEMESKENVNAEIENKENEVAEIESKENENAQIESKENENGEIESQENENAEIESKENAIAEFESKGNENAEMESKDNKNAVTESKENENAETKENGDAKIEKKDSRNHVNQLHPSKRKRTSLSSSDTSSSLMKQIALLSSVVDPRITACAAEAAISALCDEIQCPREVFDGNDTEDEELGTSPNGNKGPEVDGMDIDGRPTTTESQETSVEKNDLPLSLQMRVATATALGAAAARAKLLADQEDREIETLVANIIETQMKKVQHKSKYFDDLELLMEKEYTELEDLKESIIVERMNVLQSAFKAKSGLRDQNLAKSQTSDVI